MPKVVKQDKQRKVTTIFKVKPVKFERWIYVRASVSLGGNPGDINDDIIYEPDSVHEPASSAACRWLVPRRGTRTFATSRAKRRRESASS